MLEKKILEKKMFRERVSVENKHSGNSLEKGFAREQILSLEIKKSRYRSRVSLLNKSLSLVEILRSVPTF
jgi:hypothetical protein